MGALPHWQQKDNRYLFHPRASVGGIGEEIGIGQQFGLELLIHNHELGSVHSSSDLSGFRYEAQSPR